MTCIAAIVHDGTIYMGADSVATYGWNQRRTMAARKVFRNKDFLIGCSGTIRLVQLVEHKFQPPLHDPKMDSMKYLAAYFSEELRSCLSSAGYAWKKDEKQSFYGSFLVGYQGRLFEVCGNYAVTEWSDAFTAIGCAQDYALGVLYATQHLKNPEERVRRALEAAEYFDPGVRGPFQIEKLECE